MRAALLIAGAFLFVGCDTQEGAPAEPTADATQTVADTAPAAETAQPTTASATRPSSPAPATGALPAEWYVDSDSNAVPDSLETQIGYDPARDDCPLARACGTGAAGGQFQGVPEALLLLDSSGSMAAKVGAMRKIDVAKESLRRFVGGAPASLKIGLVAYGHQGNNTPAGKPVSCRGIDVIARPGELRRETVEAQLARFQPAGWTPIAGALDAAGRSIGDRARIILISDGIETCGGDPVAAAERLKAGGADVSIDVVGFDVSSSDSHELRKIADAGGGRYFDARTQRELDSFLRDQLAAVVATQKDELCELQDFNKTHACDTKLRLHAINSLNGLVAQLRTSGNSAAYAEAMRKRAEINAKFDERNRSRREALSRADALRQQTNKLNRTLIDTTKAAKSQ